MEHSIYKTKVLHTRYRYTKVDRLTSKGWEILSIEELSKDMHKIIARKKR